MLDTLRDVTTPELIEVQLHPAGLLSRGLAWLVDFAIRTGVLIVASTLLAVLKGFGSGILLVLWFLMEWFYPVFFEVLWKGATPGKRTAGLMVVQDNGSPITLGASLTRNLLLAADFLPFGYCFGITSILLHKEFRRLGDIVAGTLVIYRPITQPLPELNGYAPLAPAAPLDRRTQRTLVAFAERAASLTPARQEELADIVPHLSSGPHGPQGAARLLALANHIIGRRA